MKNNSIYPLFLNLLSAAIWNKPADASLFEGQDTETWKCITDLARKQSVSALIADKALSLPKKCLPPRAMVLQFITMIEQTKAHGRKMIGVLSELITVYKVVNYPFCVLKGLANGVNYPLPLLRNAGDIDLFLYRKGDYEKATAWITGNGIEVEIGNHIHNKYLKSGIWIENHSRIIYFDNKKYDEMFMEWEDKLREKENFTSIQIDNITISQLPVEMNAFYIFQHLFIHFAHDGVGFRQFCDWLLFLSKYREEIDTASFTETAKLYALLYPMQVFARAAVKYLNTPESIFPFNMIPVNKHVDLVMNDILDSGNFGFHRPGKKRPAEKIRGMWFSYTFTLRRSMKIGSISPEHIKILPFNKLINRLRIGIK